jgi:hypothetical protein
VNQVTVSVKQAPESVQAEAAELAKVLLVLRVRHQSLPRTSSEKTQLFTKT